MRLFFPAYCCLILAALPLQAQRAEIIGPDLKPRIVTLSEFSRDQLKVVEPTGKTTELPYNEVLRATFTQARSKALAQDHAIAELVDGQVLVGRLDGQAQDGEAVRMVLATGGREVELSLDDVLALRLSEQAQAPAADDDDVVLLATGEKLVGFVEAFGTDSVAFIVGDAKDPINLPLERIHAIAIANTPKPIDAPKAGDLSRVTMTDGSVLMLSSVGITRNSTGDVFFGQSNLGEEPEVLPVPLSSVQRIEPLSSSRILSPLADSEMTVLSGGEVFGIAMPPRINHDQTISVHAPTELSFRLPEGARRLVITAGLDLGGDIPPKRRALAGCELLVFAGSEQVARCELGPDSPPQRINTPIIGGKLRLVLREGINGPVLDRVRLSDAEVYIERD